METQESIREFWFGQHAADATDTVIATAQAKLWWAKDATQDALITQRFAQATDAAAQGQLDAWRATAGGRLVLILLCDQFPRNMYRNTPRAFAFAALALQIAKEGLVRQEDRHLRSIERVFFYLPLEHSESLDDQNRAVSLFGALVQEAAPDQQAVFQGFLNFALRHREVIARFGRFPHRNAILGRASSEAELQFLTEPGSSF